MDSRCTYWVRVPNVTCFACPPICPPFTITPYFWETIQGKKKPKKLNSAPKYMVNERKRLQFLVLLTASAKVAAAIIERTELQGEDVGKWGEGGTSGFCYRIELNYAKQDRPRQLPRNRRFPIASI